MNFSPKKVIVHFYTVAILSGTCRNNIKICFSQFISSDTFQSDPYPSPDNSSSNPMQFHLNSAVLYRFTLGVPKEKCIWPVFLEDSQISQNKTKIWANLWTSDCKIKTFQMLRTKGPGHQSCWSPAITIYHSVVLDCDRLDHGHTDLGTLAIKEAP